MSDDLRASLPSVDRVLACLEGLPHALLVNCARDAVDEARTRITTGTPVEFETVVQDARRRCQELIDTMLGSVINATGVLLHTNLGRAPIGPAMLHAASGPVLGYSNLEYRMNEGVRGSRHEHAGALFALAVGAEAGMIVNNNAAAVLLSLAALARGKEVVVSRGELVEIGGGFRVPEIMAESGCRLVEVGTTNRTRMSDYQQALTNETALVLKVHASNYRMVGFTEATSVGDLSRLGPPVMVDAGSGLLDENTPWLPTRPTWLGDEPGVRQAIEAGAALVTFSGDKLLGGPQAGVIVGNADVIATIGRHPLARAMRADKLTLAVLQQVACAYLDGDATRILLWKYATQSRDELMERADRIRENLSYVKVVETEAVAGGGSLPGLTIPSIGVALEQGHVDQTLAALRKQGVVARAEDGRVVCDLMTVDPADDELLIAALKQSGKP